ncbi:MAG: GNAT family N-acetyltransferase [Candidatus Brocadiaceae bacterium]|nr:GNAT family N-acetyltransferase [Candidatus Brocadiaceae bacterium]
MIGKLYDGIDDLPVAYLEAWEEQAGSQNYFLSLAWFQVFIESVTDPTDKIPFIGIEDHEGKPILLLPLWNKCINHNKWFRCYRSLTNYYSCFYQPVLLDPTFNISNLSDAIASTLLKLKNWDVIDLLPIPNESSIFTDMQHSFENAFGLNAVTPYFSSGNWFLPLSGQTFADYFSSRPSMLQNTFRRKYKKLSSNDRVEFIVYKENNTDLEKALENYTQLYRARWEKNEPYSNFIPNLVLNLASCGYLRLGILYVKRQPVAAQIWINKDNHSYIYKLAYDPSFSSYSVGTILTALMFEYAIDVDKVTLIDYLSGDDPYKKQWMTHRREMWGLQITNNKTYRGLILSLINTRFRSGKFSS